MTIRCPHCGSPVRIRGNSWECGWCRDYGPISSLRPSERAKLAQATAPSIRFTVTVTDTSQDEEAPSSFSLAESVRPESADADAEVGRRPGEAVVPKRLCGPRAGGSAGGLRLVRRAGAEGEAAGFAEREHVF